jgi:hypothetical protein|tara:strand:- start:329 stop:685 length:357 start_codon:yes stop_codon:yes gene_type:complete
MGWLTKLGVIAFIGANTKIFFRLSISSSIIFLSNFIYSKYEALLLATNPDKLFIPLYIFTAITILLIIWTLISFKWFSSPGNSKKQYEVANSFKNKPYDYAKFADVSKYPKLQAIKED